MARLFIAAGIPPHNAQTVAEALVDADLDGQASHGVMLVDMYLDRIRKGSVSPMAEVVTVSDNGAAVVLDARNALGHVSSDQAMRLAVERARRFGVGLISRSSWLSFRYRAAFCSSGRGGRLCRHRDVQHAAFDAGPGRGRTPCR